MLEKPHKKNGKTHFCPASWHENTSAVQQLMLHDVCVQHNWVYDDRLMRLSSSTHANGAIKERADKGLQLNLVSNNQWQRKDTAQTKLIMKARGLGGASVGAGVGV